MNWPFILMAIAFAVVLIGYLDLRRNLRILEKKQMETSKKLSEYELRAAIRKKLKDMYG